MTDTVEAAPEAAQEVVQTEVEQAKAPEAAESTKGQENTQPAEETEDKAPEAEEKSPAKQRRERRKAYVDQLRQDLEAETKAKAQLEARLAQFETQTAQNAPPKETDFQDYNEYLTAAAAYHAGQQFDARQKADIQREAEAHEQKVEALKRQEQEETQANWVAQVDDAKSRYADFEQVAYAAPISDDVANLIASTDGGADIAYFLGKNPAEANRISSLRPIEQAIEIGRLSASVTSPQPIPQTQAPAPVTPVKAKATPTKNVDKMSMAEYISARNSGGLK